jgi:SAM-dependent methyltransferase
MVGLACPRCDSQLHVQETGQHDCPACHIDFPDLANGRGNLPFIWPEPGAALLDWRNRYNAALADLEQQIVAANVSETATNTSKQRIDLLKTALAQHQSELTELLNPLNIGEALAKETHLALRTRLPSHHGVLSYAQNIHRDWCWGEDENKQVIDHLLDALKRAAVSAPKTVLVLGCGAGRLAYDLQAKLNAEETWGLDSNPLLCVVAQRMAAGEKISFTEFPLVPISLADTAVSRTLQAPNVVSGVHFICADGLRLPFAAGEFDLVVTPWLLDVIDAGVADVLQVIAHVLKPGGCWLNHGSIAFQGQLPTNRLSATELAEITSSQGFDVALSEDIELPYLQSPASRHRRSEIVHTQIALRGPQQHSQTKKRHQHLPEWIVKGTIPVPLTPAFQTQINTTRIHAFIMSLIDGKRSVQDMAQVLEEQRLMPAQQAVQAIRGFLTTMQEEANQLQGQAIDPNE